MALDVARNWYATHRIGDGITHIHEMHVASWLRCNIWHVQGRDRDLIIDTGMGLRPLVDEIATLSERPVTAIMTHSHFDHAGGLCQFPDRCGHRAEADVIAHPTATNTVADVGFVRAETFTALPYAGFSYDQFTVQPAPLTQLLDDGDVLDLGDRVLHVLHLPGHSPGSIALYEAATGTLFSGDVIYDGALIDDLYHSDAEQLRASHARLKELPVTTVHAGHYPSFGRDRMTQIIDEYLRGEHRLGDPEAWVTGEMTNSDEKGTP